MQTRVYQNDVYKSHTTVSHSSFSKSKVLHQNIKRITTHVHITEKPAPENVIIIHIAKHTVVALMFLDQIFNCLSFSFS